MIRKLNLQIQWSVLKKQEKKIHTHYCKTQTFLIPIFFLETQCTDWGFLLPQYICNLQGRKLLSKMCSHILLYFQDADAHMCEAPLQNIKKLDDEYNDDLSWRYIFFCFRSSSACLPSGLYILSVLLLRFRIFCNALIRIRPMTCNSNFFFQGSHLLLSRIRGK